MKRDRYDTRVALYIHMCVRIYFPSILVNKCHKRLLGTLSLPICRGELFHGLGECLESTELRVTFKVVPWRSASGEGHRIVLVPHSDICQKCSFRLISRTGVLRTYSMSWGFSGL